MGQCSPCCGIGTPNSMSEGDSVEGTGFFPQNRLNERTGNVFKATHTILKGVGHDISLSESIQASSFPPQRPAEVRVQVLCRTLKGNMKPQMYRYAPRAARFSRLPLNSPRCAAAARSTAKNAARQLRGLLALAVVVLLNLLLEPGKLFAQQTPPGDQGWSQNDQYNGQYAPRHVRSVLYAAGHAESGTGAA